MTIRSSRGPGSQMSNSQKRKLDARRAKRALDHIDVSAEGRRRSRSEAEANEILAQKNRADLAIKYQMSPAGQAAREQAKVADVISQGNKQPMTWDEVNSSGAGGSTYT